MSTEVDRGVRPVRRYPALTLGLVAAGVVASTALSARNARGQATKAAELRVQVIGPGTGGPPDFPFHHFVRARIVDRARGRTRVRWLDGRRFNAFSPMIHESRDVRVVSSGTIRADLYLVAAPGDTTARAHVVLRAQPNVVWRLDAYVAPVERPFTEAGPHSYWATHTVAVSVAPRPQLPAGDTLYVVYTARTHGAIP